MGDGLKRERQATKKTRYPQWRIEWRGRITRDVGEVYVYTDTEGDARVSFTETYPRRQIIRVSKV